MIFRRRDVAKKLRVSNEENTKKMIVHREVEKQRRQEMASLYASLRSLLPLQFIQRNIKDMSDKRDMLMPGGILRSTSTNELGCNEMLNHVVIRPCLVGVEIVFSVSQTSFSSVLEMLQEKGLCVLGYISPTVNDRLIYTLQAEVKDLAMTDLADLKDTLTLMK